MAWVNAQMRKKAGTRQIEDLSVDMQDGVALIDLVQIVGGCTLIMQRTLAKFLRNYPIICQLFFYFVIMTTYIYIYMKLKIVKKNVMSKYYLLFSKIAVSETTH